MRLIALVLSGLMALGVEAPPVLAQGAGDSPTLGRILQRGEIRIGYRSDTPPFSYDDASEGAPRGFSIELCAAVADAVDARLGITAQRRFVPLGTAERIDAVVSGEVDIECGITSVTLSRREQVDFTTFIFVTGGSIAVPERSEITAVFDLADKRVAVARGSTSEARVRDYLAAAGIAAELVGASSPADAVLKLGRGEADAVAADLAVLIGLKADNAARVPLRMLQEMYSYEPYALMLPRNDATFRLVADRVLIGMKRSGELDRLFKAHFGPFGIEPTPEQRLLFTLEALPE